MSLIKRDENKLLYVIFLLSVLLSTSDVYGFTSDLGCDNPPVNLVTSQIDTNHVTLAWQSLNSPAETLWDIEYRAIGQSVWQITSANTNPYQLSSLSPGVTYEFRVRSDCGATKSGWSINTIFASTDINNGQGCDLNLAIPDNSCPIGIGFNINVSSNSTGSILGDDVKLREVKIIIDHIWEQDLTLKLIAPNGSSVVLASSVGGSDIAGYGVPSSPCDQATIFTENSCDADFSISESSLLNFVGYFYPQNSFNGFDGSLANGQWQLELCDDGGNDVGSLFHIELVFSPFNCTPPTGVFISDESETSLKVNWNTIISGEQSRISILELGQPSSSASIFFSNDNFLEIDHLQLNTTYEVFLQRECIGGRFSDFSCIEIGSTKCESTTPTIKDDFDTEALCSTNCGETCQLNGFWQNKEGDDLDWIVNQGATPTAFTGPTDDISKGGNYLFLESSNLSCSRNGIGYLTSNCTHIIAPSSGCHIGFGYYMYGLDVNTLKLEINDFSGSGWQTIWQKNGSQHPQWLYANLDLSIYDDKDVQFRFNGQLGINGNGDIAIDQIEFYGSQDNGLGAYLYYRDMDGDGFGDENDIITSCFSDAPVGYLVQGGDCNDNDPLINPNGLEIQCNQIDENCNGMLDDSDVGQVIFQNPNTQLCFGDSTQIIISSIPEGQIEWYDAPVGGNLITTGLILNTGGLNRSNTYYAQDVVEIGSGLKITQVHIDFHNSGVEIQNIDKATDYTGWKVYVSDDRNNINNYRSTSWDLGFMNLKQIQIRTDTAWHQNFRWLSGGAFKGWVLILDDQNTVQDVLFWNWSSVDIQSFNTIINGTTILAANLPWEGEGFRQGNCPVSENNNILLSGSSESDSKDDYICGGTNFGQPNPDLDYYNFCVSGRSVVSVEVSSVVLDHHVDRNFCKQGGSIEILASNGIEPYIYEWTNGADSSHIDDVLPDLYQVTVTDGIGCSAVSPEFSLSKYTNNFGIDIIDVEQISCHGMKDGKIVMQVLDGSAPYQFNWAGGYERDLENSLDSILKLDAKTYILTVTDNNGCVIVSDEITIEEPEQIELSIDSVIHLSCSGVGNGGIYTTTIGGVIPYTYNWSNGESNDDISGLNVGHYTLTVTDNNDCHVEIEREITEPDNTLTAIVKRVKNVSCFNDGDGMIEVSPVGGKPGYSYAWTGGGDKAILSNLSAGAYNVTVSDGDNCQFSFENSIEILESTEALSIHPSISHTKCQGVEDGAIALNTQGGMPPYEFRWSEQNSEDDKLQNLASGMYICTLTDFFGCALETKQLEVLQNDYNLDIASEALTNVKCYGDDDGEIELTVEGGTTPYVALWNDESLTGQVRTDLAKGIYFATISDNFGCEVYTGNYSISEPDELIIHKMEVNEIDNGGTNGVATAFATGGSGNYTYNWNDSKNQTSQTAFGLSPGSYEVTITDVNGCEVIGFCSIVTVGVNNPQLDALIDLYPNPSTGIFHIDLPNSEQFKVHLYSSAGQKMESFSLESKTRSLSLDLSDYPNGMYILKIEIGDWLFSRKLVLLK